MKTESIPKQGRSHSDVHPVIADPRYCYRGSDTPFFRANEPANAAAWHEQYRRREAAKKALNKVRARDEVGPAYTTIVALVDPRYRSNRAARRAELRRLSK